MGSTIICKLPAVLCVLWGSYGCNPDHHHKGSAFRESQWRLSRPCASVVQILLGAVLYPSMIKMWAILLTSISVTLATNAFISLWSYIAVKLVPPRSFDQLVCNCTSSVAAVISPQSGGKTPEISITACGRVNDILPYVHSQIGLVRSMSEGVGLQLECRQHTGCYSSNLRVSPSPPPLWLAFLDIQRAIWLLRQCSKHRYQNWKNRTADFSVNEAIWTRVKEEVALLKYSHMRT